MTFDPVNRPSHYTAGRKFETIEVIEDWELGFCLGNAVKYISRAGRKTNSIEDLKKAVWYLQRQIEAEEAIETTDRIQSQIEANDKFYQEIVTDCFLTEQEEDAWAHLDRISECDLWDPSVGPLELTEEDINKICHGQA